MLNIDRINELYRKSKTPEGLSEEEKEDILSGNAKQLIRLC